MVKIKDAQFCVKNLKMKRKKTKICSFYGEIENEKKNEQKIFDLP